LALQWAADLFNFEAGQSDGFGALAEGYDQRRYLLEFSNDLGNPDAIEELAKRIWNFSVELVQG